MGAAASVGGNIPDEEFDKLVEEKFTELDADKTNYLENAELENVVNWTLEYFGDRLGSDKDEARRKIMTRIDANKDGKLDREEFKVLFKEVYCRSLLVDKARKKFAEFDTNGSGSVGTDKIKEVVNWAMTAYPADNIDNFTKTLVAAIDINNDGQLSLLEFTNLFEQMMARIELVKRSKEKFVELDKDKSGFLDGSEIDALVTWALTYYVEKTESQRVRYRDVLLKKIDYNDDGKISLVEFTDIFTEMLERASLLEDARQKFKQLDMNNSGFLERSELVSVVREWIQKYCEFEVNLENNSDALMEIFMDKIDVNRDNKISLLEFLETFEDTITTYKPVHIVSAEEASPVLTADAAKVERAALIGKAVSEFRKLDKDNSGYLERKELAGLVRIWLQKFCEFEIGYGSSDALMEMFMEKIDENNDNKISLIEFLELFEGTMNIN